jgi:hypothetical protein
MIRKVAAAIAVFVLMLNIVGAFVAIAHGQTSQKAGANPLVSMLPASDAVVVGDGKRFFTEAPKLLAANQQGLAELLAKLDEVQAKTGIDVRKFDTFAAGVSMAMTEGHGQKIDPVAIARGSVDSAQVIEAAKKATEGKAKEESVNGKKMYVVAAKDVMELAKKNAPATANQKNIQDKVAQHTMDDLAFAALRCEHRGFRSRIARSSNARSKDERSVTNCLVCSLRSLPAL